MADPYDLQAVDRNPWSSPARARLEDRVRQKEAVAQLSLLALSYRDLSQLFGEACRVVAETLSVEYCKVLELMPGGDRLRLRAGVGWKKGYVGRASVGTNLESQAGYTLISSGPVVVEDLKKEVRFEGAPLLHEHGVTSGVTVVIRDEDGSFGVLGVHSRAGRTFAHHEVLFLEDVADLLGAAIERQREEDHSLKTAAGESERAEAAERRFEFLAEANALLLASSTDYETTLRNAVHLGVPALADYSFVDVVGSGGEVRRAAVGYGSGPLGPSPETIENLDQRYVMDPNLPHGTPRVLRTGKPELTNAVGDGILRSIAVDPEGLALLRRLDPRSYVCVPLRSRRGCTGALGFISGERPGSYGREDLALAEGLAHCVALALDNAASHLTEVELAREIVRRLDASGEGSAAASVPNGDTRDLTRRQLEVLGLMAEGRTARQIRDHLHISEDTVRNHIRAIKHALDARSQLEAVAQARRLGLLSR